MKKIHRQAMVWLWSAGYSQERAARLLSNDSIVESDGRPRERLGRAGCSRLLRTGILAIDVLMRREPPSALRLAIAISERAEPGTW